MQGVLEDLAEEGLVRRVHGRGYFVADDARDVLASSGDGLTASRPDGEGAIEHRVEAVEMDISELYAKLGYKQPSHQHGGRKARHEQVG